MSSPVTRCPDSVTSVSDSDSATTRTGRIFTSLDTATGSTHRFNVIAGTPSSMATAAAGGKRGQGSAQVLSVDVHRGTLARDGAHRHDGSGRGDTFHLISEEGLGEPRSNSDAFAKLAEHGLLAATRATEMARMADFRNVVVHGYEVVDLRIVRDVVENHLGDLESYVADVDAWLSRR